MDLQQAYRDGFAMKCAEYGVDPAQLAAFGQWLKSAQLSKATLDAKRQPDATAPPAPAVNVKSGKPPVAGLANALLKGQQAKKPPLIGRK